MQAQHESNIEQTYNADEWLDNEEGAGTSSKRDRKESKRVRQDDRQKARTMKRNWE